MPVPLKCTWYNVTSESEDLVEIPGVEGACYQPSVEDIGHRIFIHALPISDFKDYQGMPLLREIGPVVVDP